MPIELTKEETADIIPALRKYFREELEHEMQPKFVPNCFLKELAPFAYNRGVQDAKTYFRGCFEDLQGTCFETALTYWLKKKK